MPNEEDTKTLIEFLTMPINSGDAVFNKFSSWSNVKATGTSPKRFLYIPGTRENKVLLVAHADTWWDDNWRPIEGESELQISGNTIKSANTDCGIGADDRAGCAMLWLLKDSGHSLLITDGEEQGRKGSKFLMEENEEIASEINRIHQFMIQIDRCNGNEFKCYTVGTEDFRDYLREKTKYSEPDRLRGTDIVTLCQKICGANLSLGYYNDHKNDEFIKIDEWLNTLNILRNWLGEGNLPKFDL